MDDSENRVIEAIAYFQSNNTSIRKAARLYHVSATTLTYRLRGRPTLQQRIADRQLLGPGQETKLLGWIETMA